MRLRGTLLGIPQHFICNWALLNPIPKFLAIWWLEILSVRRKFMTMLETVKDASRAMRFKSHSTNETLSLDLWQSGVACSWEIASLQQQSKSQVEQKTAAAAVRYLLSCIWNNMTRVICFCQGAKRKFVNLEERTTVGIALLS